MYIISNHDTDEVMIVKSLEDAIAIVCADPNCLAVYETETHKWVNVNPPGSLVPLLVISGLMCLLTVFIGKVRH